MQCHSVPWIKKFNVYFDIFLEPNYKKWKNKRNNFDQDMLHRIKKKKDTYYQPNQDDIKQDDTNNDNNDDGEYSQNGVNHNNYNNTDNEDNDDNNNDDNEYYDNNDKIKEDLHKKWNIPFVTNKSKSKSKSTDKNK